jgi:hypothetical protein
MNRRIALHSAMSLAVIVLSTESTTTNCDQYNESYSKKTNGGQTRSTSQVVIRAEQNACWKVTVDGRTHSGCGDATFYGHRSYHEATVQKAGNDGADDSRHVNITLVVNGQTVDQRTVRICGQTVEVQDDDSSARDDRDFDCQDRPGDCDNDSDPRNG